MSHLHMLLYFVMVLWW